MWVPHIYMTCAVDLEDSNGLSRGREAHLATNCDPPVGTGRQSHPNAVNLQLRVNRWWLQVETLRTWRQKDIDKDSTPWKSLKIANSPSFLINVLTNFTSNWAREGTTPTYQILPITSVLPCSALPVEIPRNLFGMPSLIYLDFWCFFISCTCTIQHAIKMQINV